jgi:hypothetical protein
MNRATRVLLALTSLLAAGAVAGCGEKEEPALAGTDGAAARAPSGQACTGEARDHAFDRARLLDGGRILRVAYVDSGSLPPCELRVRNLARRVRVTVRVPDPRAQTDDLHYWCAEGRLPEPVPKDARIISDPEARPRPRAFDARHLDRILRTGRRCIRVPVEWLG